MGGEFNVPVSCGGVAVNPGDAILADDNGIVVIPRGQLDEAIEGSLKWLEAEQAFMCQFRENPTLCYPDVTGATEIVERALGLR
jgi:regulator of RNase E activity RraA